MKDFCLESRQTRLDEGQHTNSGVRETGTIPVIFHDFGLTKFSKEVFIVRDNDELEIRV